MKIADFKLTFTFSIIFVLAFVNISAQNTCQTAQGLGYPGEPFTINGSTANANDNATSGAVFCTTSVGTGGQIWYAMYWAQDHAQVFTLTTEGGQTNFDTKIHVYTGYCGSLSCLAGDDDSGAGNSSLLQFTAYPGNYYFIRVGGFNALTGLFTLSVNGGVGGCTDQAASNYDASATWNDNSCCYGVPVQMYFGDNGQGNSAEIEFYVNGYLTDYLPAGEDVTVCVESGCYFAVACEPDNACNSWMGNTYSININGRIFSGTIPEPAYGSSYSYIDLGYTGCNCTDMNAINYDPYAFTDNGSCRYAQNNGTCYDAVIIEPNSSTFLINGGQALTNVAWPQCGFFWNVPAVWYEFVYEGGTVILEAIKFNPCDPVIALYSECEAEVMFCNDDNYSTDARLIFNCSNGLVKGETYKILVGAWADDAEMLLNYTLVDIPGCTDPYSANYNACASVDDGSCAGDGNACTADLDNNGSINVGDLLIFLTLYGTTCNP